MHEICLFSFFLSSLYCSDLVSCCWRLKNLTLGLQWCPDLPLDGALPMHPVLGSHGSAWWLWVSASTPPGWLLMPALQLSKARGMAPIGLPWALVRELGMPQKKAVQNRALSPSLASVMLQNWANPEAEGMVRPFITTLPYAQSEPALALPKACYWSVFFFSFMSSNQFTWLVRLRVCNLVFPAQNQYRLVKKQR